MNEMRRADLKVSEYCNENGTNYKMAGVTNKCSMRKMFMCNLHRKSSSMHKDSAKIDATEKIKLTVTKRRTEPHATVPLAMYNEKTSLNGSSPAGINSQ